VKLELFRHQQKAIDRGHHLFDTNLGPGMHPTRAMGTAAFQRWVDNLGYHGMISLGIPNENLDVK